MNTRLCRAKSKETGEWVEGYYIKMVHWLNEKPMHVLIPENTTLFPHSELGEFIEVYPETVCRLIEYACYDSWQEVTKLYENDIIAMWWCKEDIEAHDPRTIAVVLDESTVTEDGLGRYFPQDTTRIRLLGNAYDNPELLSGQAMNHFVNRLNDYPGTPEEYMKEHRYLIDKYHLHGAHACCYMCNFESDYVCYQYNGGCSRIETCKKIYDQEEDKRKE